MSRLYDLLAQVESVVRHTGGTSVDA